MSERSSLSAAIERAVAEATPDLSRRLGKGEDVYADILQVADEAHDETRRILQVSVDSARRAGHSWESIGRILGVSKQAVQQRFGRLPADDLGKVASETKILYPVSAFNEMNLLRELGRFGWHSVGFGVRFHRLELSPEKWEHTRVFAAPGTLQELSAQGWTRIGESSFPWAYFSRSCEIPRDSGTPTTDILRLILDGVPRR